MSLDKFHIRQMDLGSLNYLYVIPEITPGNQVTIEEGWIKIGPSLLYVPEQLSAGFTVVPTANHVRWDLLYIDFNGTIAIIPGTPNIGPVPLFTGAPDPLPYTLPLALIYVNEAGSVVVTEDDITDVRPKLNYLFLDTFSNQYAIDNGDKPHEALEKLSQEVQDHEKYSGKFNHGRGLFLPNYTDHAAPEYAISDGQLLDEAIARHDIESDRKSTFMGKDNLGQNFPDYSGETGHYSFPANTPVVQAVGSLDQDLEDKTHNSTKSINGSSPYFHVATAIYQALIAYGGHTPSVGNPFATVNWVNAQISASVAKAAWGTGAKGGFSVALNTGGISSGSYKGQSGFTATPNGVLCTPRDHFDNTDDSTPWIQWPVPSAFAIGFSQGGMSFDQWDSSDYNWIAVGH